MTDPLGRLAERDRKRLEVAPHPEWCEPVLARLTDEPFSERDWLFERKPDRERVLGYRARRRVRLLSRNRKFLNRSYPELVDALAKQTCEEFVVDGELVGQELVIGGFSEPRGSRRGFGALLLGYYDDRGLRYAGKVGTGFDDRTLVNLRKRLDSLIRACSPFTDAVRDPSVTFVRPKLVAEIGFTERTAAGRLRHPRFLGLRRDKPAEEVSREAGSAAR